MAHITIGGNIFTQYNLYGTSLLRTAWTDTEEQSNPSYLDIDDDRGMLERGHKMNFLRAIFTKDTWNFHFQPLPEQWIFYCFISFTFATFNMHEHKRPHIWIHLGCVSKQKRYKRKDEKILHTLNIRQLFCCMLCLFSLFCVQYALIVYEYACGCSLHTILHSENAQNRFGILLAV